jgi:hypothetical protein
LMGHRRAWSGQTNKKDCKILDRPREQELILSDRTSIDK